MKIRNYLENSPVFLLLDSAQTVSRKMSRSLEPKNLNFLQALILVSLFFEEGHQSRPAILHRTFGTTKGNISHCLAHLEELGFVVRTGDTGRDKRTNPVKLTSRGQDQCRKLVGYFDRIQNEFESLFADAAKTKLLLAGIGQIPRLENL